MKHFFANPRIRMAMLFFVLLLAVAIPLTLLIRARIEMAG